MRDAEMEVPGTAPPQLSALCVRRTRLMGARALGCVLVLLTASTALADLESVLKAATKFEDGWAIKLDRALKVEGADVNLLVEDPNNAGNMVTPLLVVLKAIAERKGGFAIFTNLLAHKDIDLNTAGKAPNGEKMTPILYAILFAVHADTGHGDENIGKHKHDSIHAAGALLARKEVNLSGQKMSLLGMALSAYAAGQLRGGLHDGRREEDPADDDDDDDDDMNTI